MPIYATKEFARFARRSGLGADRLRDAALDVMAGRFDANLGGGVFKQRVARDGSGKSAGFRTIVVFRIGGACFFVHGFAKNDKANVTARELKALKALAKVLTGLSTEAVSAALLAGEFVEVGGDESEA